MKLYTKLKFLFNKSKRYVLLLSIIYILYIYYNANHMYKLLSDDKILFDLETILTIIKYRSIM